MIKVRNRILYLLGFGESRKLVCFSRYGITVIKAASTRQHKAFFDIVSDRKSDTFAKAYKNAASYSKSGRLIQEERLITGQLELTFSDQSSLQAEQIGGVGGAGSTGIGAAGATGVFLCFRAVGANMTIGDVGVAVKVGRGVDVSVGARVDVGVKEGRIVSLGTTGTKAEAVGVGEKTITGVSEVTVVCILGPIGKLQPASKANKGKINFKPCRFLYVFILTSFLPMQQ